MNLSDLVNLCIAHVLSTPTLLQFVVCIFIAFTLVYRWNIQMRIRMHFGLGNREETNRERLVRKLLNCESCFGFWLCLLISTNLTTAAAAYLLYNFYEKD